MLDGKDLRLAKVKKLPRVPQNLQPETALIGVEMALKRHLHSASFSPSRLLRERYSHALRHIR